MKKIIIAIIIILILIMITIGGLLFILKNSGESLEDDTTIGDEGLDIDFKETVTEPLTDNIDFFTIQNILQGYLNSINLKSSTYFDDDGEQIMDNNEIADNIYNLLSKEYINENNITTNNIFKRSRRNI